MAESQQLSWCPGNGTRYDLIVTTIDDTFMGHVAGTLVVTIGNWKPLGLVLSPSEYLLRYQWIMEKTDLNEADASMVAVMLGTHLGIEYTVTPADWFEIRTPYVA